MVLPQKIRILARHSATPLQRKNLVPCCKLVFAGGTVGYSSKWLFLAGLEVTAWFETWWEIRCSRAMAVSLLHTWLVMVGVKYWGLSERLL